MSEPLGHERQISFFRTDGHDHDGENSTPVKLLPGAVSLFHLNDQLKRWIMGFQGEGETGEDGVMPTPDLQFETPVIGVGGSYTTTIPWVGISMVRFMRILMSQDTECTVTFYHSATFADEDREFRAHKCGNRFLWEGAWAHYDEDDSKSIHCKIENTGNQSATFQITLKSATMAANAYARFVESISVEGLEGEATGLVQFRSGNGVDITKTDNILTFNASAPETVLVEKWTLTPKKPVSFSSSATIGNVSFLSTGREDQAASFGSGLQWITADLGAITNLGGIKISQYQADGRVFNNVKVEVSGDGSSWIIVKSEGSHWATADGLQINLPSGVLARYIRVWCNGSSVDTNNYINKITPLALSDKG